jgi:hypothetical protein
MVDWARHYDHIYARLGCDAVLVIEGTDGGEFDVRVLDRTNPKTIGQDVQVHTIEPAAHVRMRQIASLGIDVETLDGATLQMNGFDWRVEAHQFLHAPSGRADGQVRLILIELQPEETA